MARTELARRLSAEAIGTAFLLATVVGSGIMGETLSGGNDAIALLGNTVATGAILVVIILVLVTFLGRTLILQLPWSFLFGVRSAVRLRWRT
ncbi:MAG: hypothetical protein CM1200mP41_10440 [Gammaproteobacteria bacterium]|nr:MAG: hypothetical protein CM1200mP41_10440 [Gammaproteobacteria bacterium]